MNQFANVSLTAGRRPEFLEDEIEVCLVDRIALLDNDGQTVKRSGRLTLTTHRVMYFSGDDFHKSLHLQRIESISKTGGLFKKDKVRINFLSNFTSENVTFVWLRSKADEFSTRLTQKLQDKKWVQKAASRAAEAAPAEFSTRRAGIAGIRRTIEASGAQQKSTLDSAFTGDLDKLMAKADELVKIADALSKRQMSDDESSEFRDMLVEVGIGSVVTKAGAGHAFHIELARQLCDFLQAVLKRNKGMCTVSDAYCIYNRARGTDLISPEDMLKACNQFETLTLPVRMKTFASGVKVILDMTRDVQETNGRILHRIEEQETGVGVSPIDVSQLLDCSVVLANIILEEAEDQEVLCVDDGPYGKQYFHNFFLTAEPMELDD